MTKPLQYPNADDSIANCDYAPTDPKRYHTFKLLLAPTRTANVNVWTVGNIRVITPIATEDFKLVPIATVDSKAKACADWFYFIPLLLTISATNVSRDNLSRRTYVL